jgi:type III restriction enzyme
LVDYRADSGANVRSTGGRTRIQRLIGDDHEQLKFAWEDFEHTNLVSARWLFQREITRRFQGALGLAPTDSPKFDALVGFGSRAHKQIQRVAADIVEAYIDNVFLKQRPVDPYTVGTALVRRDEWTTFDNALHEGYSGFNKLELPFARALDRTGCTWFRNLPAALQHPAHKRRSYTKFLPRLPSLEGRRRVRDRHDGRTPPSGKDGPQAALHHAGEVAKGRLLVRLVSEGRWNAKVEQDDSTGYTIWGRKQDDKLAPHHVDSMDEAVERCLAVTQ